MELDRKRALRILDEMVDKAGIDPEEAAEMRRIVRGNSYDRADAVRQHGRIEAGPLRIACYTVRDPETGRFGGKQFHMTFNNLILARMGEEGAELFARFACDQLGIPFGPVPYRDGAGGRVPAGEHAREDVA